MPLGSDLVMNNIRNGAHEHRFAKREVNRFALYPLLTLKIHFVCEVIVNYLNDCQLFLQYVKVRVVCKYLWKHELISVRTKV